MLLLILTLATFLNVFATVIVKFVLEFACKATDLEINLQREIIKHKKVLSTMSMADEFAKYAKTQRVINKLQEQLTNIESSRMTSFTTLKLGITYFLHIVMGLLMLYIMYMYRRTPLIVMDPEHLFPLGWILSWPTYVSGAISVPIWVFISGSVMRSVAAQIS